jgi:hypothetical protein
MSRGLPSPEFSPAHEKATIEPSVERAGKSSRPGKLVRGIGSVRTGIDGFARVSRFAPQEETKITVTTARPPTPSSRAVLDHPRVDGFEGSIRGGGREGAESGAGGSDVSVCGEDAGVTGAMSRYPPFRIVSMTRGVFVSSRKTRRNSEIVLVSASSQTTESVQTASKSI